MLPYGYLKERIFEARQKNYLGEVAEQEIIEIYRDRIDKTADRFKIHGLTPERVRALAKVAVKNATHEYDFERFKDSPVELGESFQRFMLLVVRRHLAHIMKFAYDGLHDGHTPL